jgi:hypothetical protein
VPEQDPIPPRRAARRHSPGEDDEVPPWANLPPVRPRRGAAGSGGAPHRGPRPHRDPDGFRDAPPRRDTPGRPVPDSFRDGPPRTNQGPRRDQQQFPGQAPPRREPPSGGYFSPAGPGTGGHQPPGPFGGPQEGQGGSGPGYVTRTDDYPDSTAAAFAPDDDEMPSGGPRARSARARRTLLRKRRRSLLMIGAAVVVIAAVVSVVLLNQAGGQAANISSDFVTTFQAGELRSVPNACDVIPAATVQQYLPGQVKQAAPQPIDGNLGSACNWTLDHQPTYRLLEVNMLAYAPNGLAVGNGSATSAATDAYNQQYQDLKTPPKGTPGGQATVTTLTGIGNAAFSAIQVFHVGGAVSDTATVVIRFHNVIVTAELSGLEHSNKGHYGPVNQSQLSQGALAFAQAAYTALR